MGQKLLLVEGDSDKALFHELCKRVLAGADIQVRTPIQFGAARNGKPAATSFCLPKLMPQLADGSVTHLAMVTDADYVNDGWGYAQTVQTVKAAIRSHGYGNPDNSIPGLSFPHSDGLRPFGLWVMPDNALEGMVEDWIKNAVGRTERSLLDHAVTTVSRLPAPTKFNVIHRCKSEVATWLAWQRIPGERLHSVVNDDLIDMASAPVQQVIAWLQRIYG
jgi:hypothetical protein